MKRVAGSLVIALAVLWVYFPCLQGTWLWDDGLEVTQNAALRAGGGGWRPWVHPEGLDYFPLKDTLLWMEWHLWGAAPLGYHLVNLGLHVLSALLIWKLLRLLGVRAAFVGALLFAVHPVAVESVGWISEFKNTVSLPPLLMAAVAYLEFDRDGRRGAWFQSIAWFFAALACKTSVVMFPVVLLLYSWWRRGRVGRRDLWIALPFLAEALAWGAATVWFQSSRSIGIAGIAETMGSRVAQAGWSLLAYARSCLWPSLLAPIYPPAAGSLPAVLPWLVIGAVLSFFWTMRSGWGRHALLGSGWFLLNLVPVLGIIPMAYYRVSPRADHFAYVPLVGLVGLTAAAVGAAWDLMEKRERRRTFLRLSLGIGVGMGACFLAVEAHAYSEAFHDEKGLWSRAVERNPSAWLAHSNLGKVLYQEGHLEDASRQFREAIALRPDSPEAHADLGNCLQAEGSPDEARAEYARALALNPGFAGAHYNLGLSLLKAGRLDPAMGELRRALELDPGHAAARNSLGLALAAGGRLPEAIEEYRLALASDPALPEAHLNLGNAHFRQGHVDEAVAEYREALRLEPGYSGAHHNLAVALARLGQDQASEAEFEAARRTANH